jgi:hypothetical protein
MWMGECVRRPVVLATAIVVLSVAIGACHSPTSARTSTRTAVERRADVIDVPPSIQELRIFGQDECKQFVVVTFPDT